MGKKRKKVKSIVHLQNKKKLKKCHPRPERKELKTLTQFEFPNGTNPMMKTFTSIENTEYPELLLSARALLPEQS